MQGCVTLMHATYKCNTHPPRCILVRNWIFIKRQFLGFRLFTNSNFSPITMRGNNFPCNNVGHILLLIHFTSFSPASNERLTSKAKGSVSAFGCQSFSRCYLSFQPKYSFQFLTQLVPCQGLPPIVPYFLHVNTELTKPDPVDFARVRTQDHPISQLCEAYQEPHQDQFGLVGRVFSF